MAVIGTGVAPGRRYSSGEQPSHLPGFFLPDGSSSGKVLVCKPSSSPAGASQFIHDSKQALGAVGVAAQLQAVPQILQAKLRVAAAHISDQLQLPFGMLV